MKEKMCVILLILLINNVHCIPKWYTKSYAEQEHLIYGRGSAGVKNCTEAVALEKAKNNALKDASASLFCIVSGKSVQKTKEHSNRVEDTFISEVEIKTNMRLVNYNLEKSQISSNVAYVLVSINKENLKNFYRSNVKNFIDDIQAKYNIANSQINSSPETALTNINECLAFRKFLDNDLAVYMGLNDWQNDLEEQINQLPDTSILASMSHQLSALQKSNTMSIILELVDDIEKNFQNINSIQVFPLEYDHTGFVSNFGRFFQEQLESEFKNSEFNLSENIQADITVLGNIFELNNGILLINKLNFRDGEKILTKQFFISSLVCDQIGWNNIRPQNFEKALSDKKVLFNNVQNDERLKAEIRLDEGNDGPIILRYGEKPKLYAKVNKPCYLRMIYIFSDDTKTLLFDNFLMGEEQCNIWSALPIELEVCEPSGIEQMLIQASTEIMPELLVDRIPVAGGYINVIDDLQSEVNKTRGLKILKPEKEITERIYQWSVFEK